MGVGYWLKGLEGASYITSPACSVREQLSLFLSYSAQSSKTHVLLAMWNFLFILGVCTIPYAVERGLLCEFGVCVAHQLYITYWEAPPTFITGAAAATRSCTWCVAGVHSPGCVPTLLQRGWALWHWCHWVSFAVIIDFNNRYYLYFSFCFCCYGILGGSINCEKGVFFCSYSEDHRLSGQRLGVSTSRQTQMYVMNQLILYMRIL